VSATYSATSAALVRRLGEITSARIALRAQADAIARRLVERHGHIPPPDLEPLPTPPAWLVQARRNRMLMDSADLRHVRHHEIRWTSGGETA